MSLTSNAARNGNHTVSPAPYRRLPLKRNILWTGAGTAVYYVAQYALLSLIAKLTNAVSVGQFALGIAVTTPIIMFSQMQFRSLQVTDSQNEYSFQDYFWTRIYGTILALLVIALTVFTGSYSPEARTVILVFGIAKGFESLGDLTYGTLQSADRMDYVALSQGIKSALIIALFGGILYLTRQLLPAVLVLGGVWALVFFGFDLPFARKVAGVKSLWVFPSAQTIKQLVVLSLPLALTATLNAYLLNLPRYELKHLGETQVGYFSAVSSLIGLIMLITTTVTQATLARVSRYYQTGEYLRYFRLVAQTAALHVGISLSVTLAVWLGGAWLIGGLYTPAYRPYTGVLILMCAGMTLNSLGAAGSITLYAARRFRHQLVYTVILLALCLPLYHSLIGRYGIIGAGWAEFTKFCIAGTLMLLISFPTMRDLWHKARSQEESK